MPSLIIAHLIDQFEWGDRVHKLGAGPAFIPRFKLDAGRFQRGYDALLDTPEYTVKATEIGCRICGEPDGLESAVRIMDRIFRGTRSGSAIFPV